MHEYIVGLDIGSSNVYGAVGKVDSTGEIRIVGITSVNCTGLKKSVVVDIDSTSQSIKECINNLERMVDISISDVYVALPAGICELVWNKGIVAVSSDDREIRENDVMRVLEAAKLIRIPSDKEIIGVVPQQYIVDGYDNITEPIGMSGMRLEVEAQVVMAKSTVINNLRKSIKKAQVGILGEVLQQQAIAEAVSKKEDMDMGIALIDVGGQTTNVSIYKRGSLCYTSMIPLGGENITNDISVCLKIPYKEAEKLKIKYGNLDKDIEDNAVRINVNAGYDNSVEIDFMLLQKVIEARTEEILLYAKEKLEESGYYGEISGVVLVGGGLAQFKGISKFATNILDKSLRVAYPAYTGAASPVYATVVGVVRDVVSSLKIDKSDEDIEKFATKNSVAKNIGRSKKEHKYGFISRIKDFFTEFF